MPADRRRMGQHGVVAVAGDKPRGARFAQPAAFEHKGGDVLRQVPTQGEA